VFAHGVNSSAATWDPELLDAVRAQGHEVFATEVPPFASVANRAAALALEIDDILEATGAERVHVLAHSMGGLDARYLISILGYGDRVATLTTLSTPHRGSRLADVALNILDSRLATPAQLIADALGTGIDLRDRNVREALWDLSEAHGPRLSGQLPDDERVAYQSFAGLSNIRGVARRDDRDACSVGGAVFDIGDRDVMLRGLNIPSRVVGHVGHGHANDGVVRVASSVWGNFRGCRPLDHGTWSNAAFDSRTGFDTVAFYLETVADLTGQAD